jgi:hypothetical protein
MMDEIKSRSRRTMLWGLFLIVLGTGFLLERFGYLSGSVVGQLWPAVFFVIAVSHALDRRPGSAVMFFLMGCWFFACTFDWYGLSYRNSWGLLLVAVGAGMVVRALGGEPPRGHRGGDAS